MKFLFKTFKTASISTLLSAFLFMPGISRAQNQWLDNGVIDRGVLLGGDHPPGRYVIYGIFTHQPLTRQWLRAHFNDHAPRYGIDGEVVVREVEVR